MPIHDGHTRYSLSTHDKSSLEQLEYVSTDIQEALVERQTSVEAQTYIEQLWANDHWIGCACAEGAYLGTRKLADFTVLVRLTARGEHAADCVFSEANMPIYRKTRAEKLTATTLSFHKAKPKRKEGSAGRPPITVNSLEAESSKLARFMFTLYDDAGLNSIPLSGAAPQLNLQYNRIRKAANRFNVAGHSGSSVIYTHPAAVKKAIAALNEKKWPTGTIPQVLLFFTVDQIDGRHLVMNIGSKSYELECKSRVEFFNDDVSPPFNVLMTLAQRQESSRPEVLKASALPIYRKNWLMPVKNNLVRKFINTILAKSKDYDTYDAVINFPFFAKEFDGVSIRPDFSIERKGECLSVFYFTSRKDVNFAARKGEIDFLQSHDIPVCVFDMDKVRDEPEKDAWRTAAEFFEKYIKHYKLEKTPAVEEQFDEPEEAAGRINLLA